jgi:two-component system sensor histidine kinase AlgZ
MGLQPGQGTQGRMSSPEFFIPDLCASRSVFVMILLAQLLVIVHVLALSSLPLFDWSQLASSTVIVQWLVTLASSYLSLQLPDPFGGGPVTSWQLARHVLVAVVVAGIVLRYFYLLQQLRRQEKLELQSRLDSLRDRIRPHFLFNTLNSIASLIVSRPQAAEKAVEDLSELFRMSLQEERRDTTVADELRLCELYLEIEKLRLGDRLRVEWQVEDAAREQPMPSLVLQPLVENAIYHGVATLPGGGTVRVQVSLSGAELRASIENPVGDGAAARPGHQMALDNVRHRLEALHGAAARLQVSPQAGRFRVELAYPREMLP